MDQQKPNAAPDVAYAGHAQRFLAHLVDGVALGAAVLGVFGALYVVIFLGSLTAFMLFAEKDPQTIATLRVTPSEALVREVNRAVPAVEPGVTLTLEVALDSTVAKGVVAVLPESAELSAVKAAVRSALSSTGSMSADAAIRAVVTAAVMSVRPEADRALVEQAITTNIPPNTTAFNPTAVIMAIAAGVNASDLSFTMSQATTLASPVGIQWATILLPVGFLIFLWFYFAEMEHSHKQGTAGKRSMSIKVVDVQTGKQISVTKGTIRYVVKILGFLPNYALVYFFGGSALGAFQSWFATVDLTSGGAVAYFMVLLVIAGLFFATFVVFSFPVGALTTFFTPKRQAIHDMAAGTLVVQERMDERLDPID